jgi:hypothetical protein
MKTMPQTRSLKSLAVAAVFLVPGAGLAAKAPLRAAVVQEVLDCRKLTDSAQRLACYDKAVDGMAQADAKGDLVTVDREQRREVRKQAFGLSMPSLAIFDRGEKPEEVNRITAVVASASKGANDWWTITLDDGAVWRQIADGELLRDPHKGSTVTIRKASLGSYFMNVDGQSAIRVHREN